jgi:hypothetical protein
MNKTIVRAAIILLLGAFAVSAYAATSEVLIYTGTWGWTDEATADAQAQICVNRLTAAGIANAWYRDNDAPTETAIANWVTAKTTDGVPDVLVLYGSLPNSIYTLGNSQVDGSLAELFIESTDGNAIINSDDWMFYVSSAGCCNGAAGLQNIMDIPTIEEGPDWTAITVTATGQSIAPSLTNFWSYRPLWLDKLAGTTWVIEALLGQNGDGTRGDPVIVRDADRGRIIPLYQTWNHYQSREGAVQAEVIAWLLGKDFEPTAVVLSSLAPRTATGTATKFTVSIVDVAGVPTPTSADVTVSLSSDSGTGAFSTSFTGPFTATSVTIPAGKTSATVYYRDTTATVANLSGTAAGLTPGALAVTVFASAPVAKGEVAFYTGTTAWFDQGVANVQSQVCSNKLSLVGIGSTIYASSADEANLANWVSTHTNNGKLDFLVLYGAIPTTIYGCGNAEPNGSRAELFIESPDGDAIIGHGDYFFYVGVDATGAYCWNEPAGLQNMMDHPWIGMWDDNTPALVTDEGRAIARHLTSFTTSRPFHVNELLGNWFVEAQLSQDYIGGRSGACIVRDGSTGRLIATHLAGDFDANQVGTTDAEIIAWLNGYDTTIPGRVGFAGRPVGMEGQPVKLTVQIQDAVGGSFVVAADTAVSLSTSSGTGAFDTALNGAFDGSVTSVTIAAGQSGAVVYYKDTTPGTPTLTGTAGALTGTQALTIFAQTFAPMGEVVIYTGGAAWICKVRADAQAQICKNRLDAAAIPNVWYQNDADQAAIATWMTNVKGNGHLDVLVIYGAFPRALYPTAGWTLTDGSLAELYIESTDGDVIINHGDWMFYCDYNGDSCDPAATRFENGATGLQSMMDNPAANMNGPDVAMYVTADGKAIAPTLPAFITGRPMWVDTLAGNWVVEAALAQNADGTLADPVIMRDGDRGRLIPVFQTPDNYDPKGAVAADIIAWLYGKTFDPAALVLSGSTTTVTGTPVRLTITAPDAAGFPTAGSTPIPFMLTSSSATGAFDTAFEGSFDGTVTSVIAPVGASSLTLYYRDSSPGLVTLTAEVPTVATATLQVNVVQGTAVVPGQVAFYYGSTSWIGQTAAAGHATFTADKLSDLGILSTMYPDAASEANLATWMNAATGNGKLDVLVTYGVLPGSIYPLNGGLTDGTIAEKFLESTDGDAIINHADWMFYVSSQGCCNGPAGLQSMMDNGNAWMDGPDVSVAITDQGAAIAPSLSIFKSSRPMWVDRLAGEWFVEATLAQGYFGTRADPIITRDGPRGRVIPAIQVGGDTNPDGPVAAEIIAWLMETATPSFTADPTSGRAPLAVSFDASASAGSIASYEWDFGDTATDSGVTATHTFQNETTATVDYVVTLTVTTFRGIKTQAQTTISVEPRGTKFVRGDINADGKFNIADPVCLLGYLFGAPGDNCKDVTVPACFEASDVNDDGKHNIADPTYLLGYLFAQDDAPPLPFPTCGFDPEPAGHTPFGCEVFLPACP